jgi:hypothetical protein
MSLHDIFLAVVRNKLYAILKQGILRDWGTELTYSVIDQAMNEKMYEIQEYLQNHVVTLENMNGSAQYVAEKILFPYITQKRVE